MLILVSGLLLLHGQLYFANISNIYYIVYSIGDHRTMNIEQFFFEHPVFRLNDFVRWKTGYGAYNKQAINSQIQHYLRSGRLLRVRRELYAVIPPNETSESLSVDPYLIAGKVTDDSILAFHTALELFGVAYSSFEQFTYLSQQKTKPFEFQARWFQSVAFPVRLRSHHDISFEVETIHRSGIDIRITSLSRTYVDVLNRVELSGGWEEVVRSIDNLAVIDIDRVIDYCLKLNNAILSAKVGYFLEERQGAFAATNKQINKLLKKKPTVPQYLSKQHAEPCRLIKKWNIMMPISVIERSWEEPEHDI